MLDNISYIAKRLQNFRSENHSLKGKFGNLSEEDIQNISQIWAYVEECTAANGDSIHKDNLIDFVNGPVEVQISTGNIKGYFDTFSSFIIRNEIEASQDRFYIRDLDVLSEEGRRCDSKKLTNYFK